MNVLKKIALASTLIGFSGVASASGEWVGSIDVTADTSSVASDCYWGYWNYISHGGGLATEKYRYLSCSGKSVAKVQYVKSYNNNGQCYISLLNSEDYRKESQSQCAATFYKKPEPITVYPGDQCSWVQKQSYYGYDYYDFKCFYHGVVATKTVGYPWSYSSPGYSCSIGAKTGFNVTTTGTGLGDTQCDVTKVTK